MSLGQMLQVALIKSELEKKRGGGRIAGVLESALDGFNKGMDDRREWKRGEQDRELKSLQIDAIRDKMARDARQEQQGLDFLRGHGYLPPAPEHAGTAREAALDTVSERTPTRQYTPQGRMAEMVDGAMDREVSFNPADPAGSIRVTYRKEKEKEEKDPSARLARVRNAAEEAARRDAFQKAQELHQYQAAGQMANPPKYADIQVTEEETAKYLPEMEQYLTGETDTATSLRQKRENAQALDDLKRLGPEFMADMPIAGKRWPGGGRGKAQERVKGLRGYFDQPRFKNLEKHLTDALYKSEAEGNDEMSRKLIEYIDQLRAVRGVSPARGE